MLRKILPGLLLPWIATVACATQIFLTSGTTWTVPADWNSQQNTVEVIGYGGYGDYTCVRDGVHTEGGGGGAYSEKSNLVLTPGASISINFTPNGLSGSGNFSRGFVWFQSSTTVYAQNGTSGVAPGGLCIGAGLGGQASAGFGDVTYSGGNGGPGQGLGSGIGPGGGAAGPFGAGGNADQSGSGATGGQGDNGHGGAGGSSATSGNGGNGTEFDASHGSGGGGQCDAGGAYTGTSGNYGAGSCGTGFNPPGPGLIVITYTPRRRVSSGVF